MVLFLKGVFFPDWMVYLSLFGLVACPIFSGIGIYYLIRKKYKQSTIVLSLITSFLFFGGCHLFNLLPDTQMSFLVYLTVPFGFAATAIFGLMGLSVFALLIGTTLNFMAIFGAVGLIERFFEKRFQ